MCANLNIMEKIICTTEECASMLEKTKWAEGFSWPQMKIIAEHITPYKASNGTVVFSESDHDNTMGVVVSGKVNILKKDAEGDYKIIATVKPSQTFGEMSLLDNEPRSARAEVSGEAVLLLITKKDFDEMANTKAHLAFHILLKIAQTISGRLRRTSGQLVEYLHED